MFYQNVLISMCVRARVRVSMRVRVYVCVCDLAIIVPKIPLCLYNTLIT